MWPVGVGSRPDKCQEPNRTSLSLVPEVVAPEGVQAARNGSFPIVYLVPSALLGYMITRDEKAKYILLVLKFFPSVYFEASMLHVPMIR